MCKCWLLNYLKVLCTNCYVLEPQGTKCIRVGWQSHIVQLCSSTTPHKWPNSHILHKWKINLLWICTRYIWQYEMWHWLQSFCLQIAKLKHSIQCRHRCSFCGTVRVKSSSQSYSFIYFWLECKQSLNYPLVIIGMAETLIIQDTPSNCSSLRG